MKYKIKLKYKISTIPKVDIVLIFLYFAKIQLIINNVTHYNYTTRRK